LFRHAVCGNGQTPLVVASTLRDAKSHPEIEIMKNTLSAAALVGITLTTLATTAALADTKPELDVSVHETIKAFDALNPNNRQLRHSAAGILVFPRVTKGGAGIAGEYGEGALRIDGKTVGYYSVSSASIGLTLGAAKRSEILVFTSQDSLNQFTNSKGWSIGADTGVALISKGGGANYDTDTLKKPVLGFVFAEKGLLGDLSLEGSKIDKIDR
jgi:lipid-binding SYLF domain-containing protein